jgi:hypothetical protein
MSSNRCRHRIIQEVNFLFSLLVTLAVMAPSAGASSEMPRPMARQNVEHAIADVRANMNSNPGVVSLRLSDELALPIGDDPRVLELCADVVAHSTSIRSVHSAVNAIHIIIQRWQPGMFGRSNWRRRIAAALNPALESKDFDIRLSAVKALADLGGQHKERAYAQLKRELNDDNRSRILSAMLPAFGERAEIIEMVLTKAQSPDSSTAVEGLKQMGAILALHHSENHRFDLPQKELDRISNVANSIADSSDRHQSIAAAEILEQAGHKTEAYRHYRQLISTPIPRDDVRARKDAIDLIVSKMIQTRTSDAEDLAAMRQAETANGLLKEFDDSINTVTHPGLSKWKQDVIDQWRRALVQK